MQIAVVGSPFSAAASASRIVQPVQAWRVVGLLRTEARFDAAHGGAALTELVGRDEEVALLKRHWQWARGGEGQVVLLSGETGIGKSRLTQVLRKKAFDANGVEAPMPQRVIHVRGGEWTPGPAPEAGRA